jgi:hypothetical protein
MASYYVEVWQPAGTQAEAAAKWASFDEAVAWLEQRFSEDRHRIGRFLTHEDITAEQSIRLSRYPREGI